MHLKDAFLLDEERQVELGFELSPPLSGPWVPTSDPLVWTNADYCLKTQRRRWEGAQVLDFQLSREPAGEFVLLRFEVFCQFPSLDMITPAPRFTGYAHIKSHNPETLVSTATTKDPPYVVFGSRSGENRIALGLKDLIAGTRIYRGGSGGHMYYDSNAIRFTRPYDGVPQTLKEFSESVFLSTEAKSWFHVSRSYWDWVDAERGYVPEPTPESAKGPVWCSWLYLTDIDQKKIWESAVAAKDLGIRTVDIDAGWYCPESEGAFFDSPLTNRTFGFGRIDADQRKFPDLRGLVDRIHDELGLFVWAWATPRWAFRAVEDGPLAVDKRLLDTRILTADGKVSQFLCTRNPDARLHARQFTAHILSKYGFDGLKFDCWENAAAYLADEIEGQCVADHEHDVATTGEGTYLWAKEVAQSMKAVKPDCMVWFNNTSLKQFSNYSCSPNEVYCQPDENWRMSVLVKTFSRGIVSQLMEGSWHREEQDKHVARQLAVFMMGHVPELQVDLLDLTDSHKILVRAANAFYSDHRQELLFGAYEPFGFEHTLGGPLSTTPAHVRIDGGAKLFLWVGPVTLDPIAVASETKEIFVFNLKSQPLETLPLSLALSADWTLECLDLAYLPVSEAQLRLGEGLTLVTVGIGEGCSARLRRKSL